MSQRFEPQIGADELAPHAHRCELYAPPDALRFPPICAHCGGAAAERLSVAKVFRRICRAELTRFEVLRVAMPCCPACQALHRAQTPPLARASELATMLFTGEFAAALSSGAIALFLLWLAVDDIASDAVGRAVIWITLAAIFAVFALAAARRTQASTERFRVPPQTSVSKAFDFSNNIADAFDRPRHVYAMRDRNFAAQFIAANHNAIWDPAQPSAQRAANLRRVVTIIAVLVMVAFVAWQIIAALVGGSG
jgi:hypothetical protein